MKNILAVFILLLAACAAAWAETKITPVLNRDYLNACVGLIDSARSSIDVSQLYFQDDEFTAKVKNALYRARARKVYVRVLLEGFIKENTAAINEFRKKGIDAGMDSPKRQNHNKFLVADGKAVLLGSTNMSEKSINENNEANVLIDDPAIGQYYSSYFDFLYSGAHGYAPYYKGGAKRVLPFSPKKYFYAVVEILQAPHKKIGVVMYNMRSYPGKKPNPAEKLIYALEKAAGSGADVRVILENSDYDKEINRSNLESAAFLKKSLVKVRFDSPKVITHAKLIVADGVAVLGSANWGMAGFAKNEEVNVEIWDRPAVDAYWSYFEELWKNSRE
jgi:phosphatidylserine/phosphatidylglycerophosphate/cardiolipin synthase-like enzyme